MPRLNQDEIVTLHTLKEKNQSNREIARTLGVTEGAVRYQLRKAADPRPDGRNKAFKAGMVAEPIGQWIQADQEAGRETNIRDLYEWLASEHQYPHSYKSVYRYVRAHYPPPKRRPYRRVELPAGAQGQVDWCERTVMIAGQPRKMYGFWMVLSHSRADALIWQESMDQLHWQHGHNEAFRRLGGVPASIRIDNLKTGMSKAGPRGHVNAEYARYARSAGFHVDACAVRHPEAKGKVESRVAKLPNAGELKTRNFASLQALQAWTDEKIGESWKRRNSPASGESVEQALSCERVLLGRIDELPEPFDAVVSRKVGKDCMISFEGRSYSVPFSYAWSEVEVRGGPGRVEIWSGGKRIAVHARTGEGRIHLDPSHFEGEPTDTHIPPLPLGQVGRTILERAEADVEVRAADYYQAILEACA